MDLDVMELLALPIFSMFSKVESRNGEFRKQGRLIKRNFDFCRFNIQTLT